LTGASGADIYTEPTVIIKYNLGTMLPAYLRETISSASTHLEALDSLNELIKIRQVVFPLGMRLVQIITEMAETIEYRHVQFVVLFRAETGSAEFGEHGGRRFESFHDLVLLETSFELHRLNLDGGQDLGEELGVVHDVEVGLEEMTSKVESRTAYDTG